ncbi:MAG: PAS domain-containing sensor histidine kinase [Robiginitomaculum sp.]
MTSDTMRVADTVKATSVIRSAMFGLFYTLAAVLTGLSAVYALSGSEGHANKAIPALWLNLILVLSLGIYLLISLRRVFFNNETGSAAHLHQRFVLILSMAALVPALLVGLFFTTLMSRNLNTIFGPRVSEIMEFSGKLSSAYLEDKYDEIGQGALDIAGDLNQAESQFSNRITYTAYLLNQAIFREFPMVIVIDGQGRVLARAEGPASPGYIVPRPEYFEAARSGSITFIPQNEVNFIGALYKLENYNDAFLYTGRNQEEGFLKNIDSIEIVGASIDTYTGNSKALRTVFLLFYVEVALLIFFAAVWLALVLANRIVSPLGAMINAAEKVRGGDLDTRVNVPSVWDEISDLANAFNRMTKQLSTQREDLVREHAISEQRREFSEAVLSGVSAGVIGLSPDGVITVFNKSAERLLGIRASDVLERPLATVLKGFLPAFIRAQEHFRNRSEDQVNLETPMGTKNLDIRISSYKGERLDTGWVITFDDMTRLVAAQRHSAWREVARRIAHEIKNPLTPIQLSAERLERKYAKEIHSNPEVFKKCTQTIVRQVSNLGRMVDEFSAFARMPAPVLQSVKLSKMMKDTLFSQGVAFPEVKFTYENHERDDIEILCDERLIGQALTNLYKNAGESISRCVEKSGKYMSDGQISSVVSVHDNIVWIDISDNGEGWPVNDYERLLEPYMTTRDQGTGLGLAIVKRILEDHGGDLELIAPSKGKKGAHVRLKLPHTDSLSEPQIPSAHKVMKTYR